MSEPGLPAERTSVARPLILALLGLGALGAAGFYVLRPRLVDTGQMAAVQPIAPTHSASTPALSPPAAPAPRAPAAPGFDIVRISPNGDAVLAGHAAPGAEVTVKDADHEVGHATADSAGDWVIVPTAPLPPGARTLTLSQKLPDGTSTDGAGSVLAVVPGAPPGTATVAGAAPATPPLAVLDQPGAAPRVLQAPPGGKTGGLGLGAVDYDDHGQMRFAGNAPASAPVRVYVDNHPLGDATADARGRWTLAPSGEIAPGPHRLRVDQLDANGRVVSRIELPFLREQMTPELIGDSRVVVQPGENLWRIARRSYGKGVRYTVIYQANQSQIRDPRRIYPGQLLTVPPEGGKQTQ